MDVQVGVIGSHGDRGGGLRVMGGKLLVPYRPIRPIKNKLFLTRRAQRHEGFLGGVARFFSSADYAEGRRFFWGVAPAAGRGSNVAGQPLLLRSRSGSQP